MDTDTLEFKLSEEDEHVVRSYECTRLKPLFAPEAVGRLTVTNKRVVYHSHGSSMTGQSVMVSEMPIEDSAGVAVYLGNSINWPLFAAFAIGLYIVCWIVEAVLPGFFTSWVLGVLLMLPYGILKLFNTNVLSDDLKQRAVTATQDTLAKAGPTLSAEQWYRIARVLFYIGVVVFAWAVASTPAVRYGLPFIDLILMAAVFFFVFMAWFGRQKVFTLVVGSRSMQGSGIFIPGTSFRLFGNRTAADTLTGHPASDADTVARELGALLTDIRQLGELGVQKWQVG